MTIARNARSGAGAIYVEKRSALFRAPTAAAILAADQSARAAKISRPAARHRRDACDASIAATQSRRKPQSLRRGHAFRLQLVSDPLTSADGSATPVVASLLRDFPEAGDAPHLSANHRAPAGAADCDHAKTRRGRAFSLQRRHGCSKTADAFPSAHLVPAIARPALEDFPAKPALRVLDGTRAIIAHLFWAHRGSSAPADRAGKAERGFVPRRGCAGRSGKICLPRRPNGCSTPSTGPRPFGFAPRSTR